MPLVNCIYANLLNIAIHNCANAVNSLLKCVFIKWMIDYLSIIKVLYDIVSRAVEANIREYMPTARTNKEKIKYRRIKFFDAVTKVQICTIAISVKKPNSAVQFCACKFFKGGDDIFD